MTRTCAIPRIDFQKLMSRDETALQELKRGAEEVGFLVMHNTSISEKEVRSLLEAYANFFALPLATKERLSMSKTGSNRGWGGEGSEKHASYNPDRKQVFDIGQTLNENDDVRHLNLHFYAENQWPREEDLPGFRAELEGYFTKASALCCQLLDIVLEVIADSVSKKAATTCSNYQEDPIDLKSYFHEQFTRPMALFRGNFYPPRPEGAGEQDFGIAPHTDYGFLTWLATDGQPGLEVRLRNGSWFPVTAAQGEFVINFGDMLQMCTGEVVKATEHRVRGTAVTRQSIPLFFNPNFDTNVAQFGSGQYLSAAEHLTKRNTGAYVHLKKKKEAAIEGLGRRLVRNASAA